MTRGYLKSSPYFFRIIKIAWLLATILLLVLAALWPAPLQEPADLARVPNPVKSAWFLLWIQEVVSYSKYLIYAVLAVALGMILLPWLPGQQKSDQASWLGTGHLRIAVASLVTFAAVLLLTVIAGYFRGENWAFVLPF
ncbi:cytochrome b6 [Geomonas limicola]|uniref:Cytochrome b6 n=1 Tax=Geomonas limicola TaxID=2740186 RepID=A0A6V8N9S2_9BACT|nr:selenite/tellurite reduction operon b-type cytochrome membrane protein ExtQ [Geomonas limicola]GFO69281.1 cytochrome b6 [Geomonas limicola]